MPSELKRVLDDQRTPETAGIPAAIGDAPPVSRPYVPSPSVWWRPGADEKRAVS
jgi:hypothetical protein